MNSAKASFSGTVIPTYSSVTTERLVQRPVVHHRRVVVRAHELHRADRILQPIVRETE